MAFYISRSFRKLDSLNRTSKSTSRLHFSTDVIRKDRYIDRVKKFVFGEGAPPEKLEETSDSYYELTKTEEPSVYTLKTHEIVDKLESIVSKTLPQSQKGGKWEQESVMDIVLKYEVLNRCYEELGLLVPNYQLNQLNTIKDVINFFTSVKPKNTRTFQSIDINNLPPNLNIGGKVPWKSISS